MAEIYHSEIHEVHINFTRTEQERLASVSGVMDVEQLVGEVREEQSRGCAGDGGGCHLDDLVYKRHGHLPVVTDVLFRCNKRGEADEACNDPERASKAAAGLCNIIRLYLDPK